MMSYSTLFLIRRWKNDTTHDNQFSRMFIVTTPSTTGNGLRTGLHPGENPALE
jgi:hypothetical protein